MVNIFPHLHVYLRVSRKDLFECDRNCKSEQKYRCKSMPFCKVLLHTHILKALPAGRDRVYTRCAYQIFDMSSGEQHVFAKKY